MKVVIVGAGPAGLLLAHFLCRRPNYDICVLEKRPDPRVLPPDELRTFPITLQTQRGLLAVQGIPGLEQALENQGCWTSGAKMYAKPKATGKSSKVQRLEYPKSLVIDRNDISLVLLRDLMKYKSELESKKEFSLSSFTSMSPKKPSPASLTIDFDSSVESMDFQGKTIQYKNKRGDVRTMSFDCLVAADGARSTIRDWLGKEGALDFEMKPIPDRYKPIYLLRKSDTHQLDDDVIQGCRVGNMGRMILAPNKYSDTFSGVIFYPPGQDPFEECKGNYKDFLLGYQSLVPEEFSSLLTDKEAKEYLLRPESTLLTIRCDRLHVNDSYLLIGDSAHAVSASLGQGCNAALQDVRVFVDCLDATKTEEGTDDWKRALPEFTKERLESAHALEELSSYSTPRSKLMWVEFFVRIVLDEVIRPKWLKRVLFLRPMPMALLQWTNLTYAEINRRTQWWTRRVKRSLEKMEE